MLLFKLYKLLGLQCALYNLFWEPIMQNNVNSKLVLCTSEHTVNKNYPELEAIMSQCYLNTAYSKIANCVNSSSKAVNIHRCLFAKNDCFPLFVACQKKTNELHITSQMLIKH